jgi:hypothetical protein
MFHDAMPVLQPESTPIDATTQVSHTGPPFVVPDDIDQSIPWIPYTILPHEFDAEVPISNNFPLSDEVDADVFHHTPNNHDHSQEPLSQTHPSSSHLEDTIIEDAIVEENDLSENYDELETLDAPSTEEGYIIPTRRSVRIQSQKAAGRIPFDHRYRAYASVMMSNITLSSDTMEEAIIAITESCDHSTTIGESGMDSLPFIPEPVSIKQLLREPLPIREAWKKAFVKEADGIINTYQAVEVVPITEPNKVIPVKVVFKCKTNKDGKIDKLKCRIVVRGDLHDPVDPMDSWNPHATWTSLRLFLAICARNGIFPSQTDFVMAYLQAEMRERVYIKFPQEWSELLPSSLHSYCGVPLRLRKALYGYTYSGKFLYEEQADFFRNYGLRQTIIPALWIKYFGPEEFLIVLHYSDDLLAAAKPSIHHYHFIDKLKKRFSISHKERADFYLQARIRVDVNGNIYLDQQRYAKAIIQRYLPNVSPTPTSIDINKYRHTETSTNKWTRNDNSLSRDDVKKLEAENNLRYIEAVGSLNYLCNTFPRGLYTIRKLCKFMNLPGAKHFRSLIHFLHHIRCHPPGALVFYRDVKQSPLYALLRDAGYEGNDPSIVWFSDSSHNDCDDQRSTACHLGFVQGGLVDFSSFVPSPIPMSSAESESNALCVASMAASYMRQAYTDIVFNDSAYTYTIPIYIDNTAAEAMTMNDRHTNRTKHIERRALLHRSHRKAGLMMPYYISGNTHNLADIGTKANPNEKNYKLSIMEHSISEEAITTFTSHPVTIEEG